MRPIIISRQLTRTTTMTRQACTLMGTSTERAMDRGGEAERGSSRYPCGLALVMAFVVGQLGPATEHWGFLVAMAIGLVPIARRALMAARTGTPFSIEMLMTIAAVGAVIIGVTEEAATVVFLFLIGELLEG